MQEVKAVIFDMDGLMLDTESIARDIWMGVATDIGLSMDEAFYLRLIGRTYPDIVSLLEQTYGDVIDVNAYVERCLELYREHIHQPIAQRPGLGKMLAFCKERGLKMAVGTSAGRELAEVKLRSGGLEGHFETVVTGSEVKNGKPSPEIFLKAAEKLGIPPEQCLVLEDSPNGVKAAHAAKMRVIMIPDMVQPQEEIRALANAIFHSLDKVPDYMQMVRWA